mmetsp:Transcript_12142/g.25664  ORF Transcript_12142/g.25664 Transcript_12142/m.25664 type:complete len:251 (-) Transcript_12142:465-1217(-)
MPVMMNNSFEATSHKRMLLDDLADVRPLDKLQRLGADVWLVLGGSQQSLPLVHAIAERQDVLSPFGALEGLDPKAALDLARERRQFPVQGRRTLGAFISRPRREDLYVLQRRKQCGHELLAAQLDPAPLCVGDDDHRAMLLRDAQRLGRNVGYLCKLLPLPGGDLRAIVEAQALALHPCRRKNRVIPIEDQHGLLRRESSLLSCLSSGSGISCRCGIRLLLRAAAAGPHLASTYGGEARRHLSCSTLRSR